MITRRLLMKRLRKNQERSNDRIGAYVKRPTPENVHDLRTAARRLLATIQLLPKNVRKDKRTKTFSEKYARLISLNAKVRDLDIIISRAIARQSDSQYAKLAKNLADRRKSALKSAIQYASSMNRNEKLSLRKKALSDTSVRKRFDKTAKRLKSRIAKRLPVVLEDSKNIRELHRLREDSRMLRYIIEVGEGSKSSKRLVVLRSWQEILGLIHDSDIVIDFLRNEEESPEIRDLVRDELTERNKNYETFASMALKSAPRLGE